MSSLYPHRELWLFQVLSEPLPFKHHLLSPTTNCDYSKSYPTLSIHPEHFLNSHQKNNDAQFSTTQPHSKPRSSTLPTSPQLPKYNIHPSLAITDRTPSPKQFFYRGWIWRPGGLALFAPSRSKGLALWNLEALAGFACFWWSLGVHIIVKIILQMW